MIHETNKAGTMDFVNKVKAAIGPQAYSLEGIRGRQVELLHGLESEAPAVLYKARFALLDKYPHVEVLSGWQDVDFGYKINAPDIKFQDFWSLWKRYNDTLSSRRQVYTSALVWSKDPAKPLYRYHRKNGLIERLELCEGTCIVPITSTANSDKLDIWGNLPPVRSVLKSIRGEELGDFNSFADAIIQAIKSPIIIKGGATRRNLSDQEPVTQVHGNPASSPLGGRLSPSVFSYVQPVPRTTNEQGKSIYRSGW